MLRIICESNTFTHDFDYGLNEINQFMHDFDTAMSDFDTGLSEINPFMAGFDLLIDYRMKSCMKTQMFIDEQTKSSQILIMFMHGYYKVNAD